MARASATCLRLGASTAEAPDCSTEMPMRRMKAALSCRITYCTVRPFREAIRSCSGEQEGESKLQHVDNVIMQGGGDPVAGWGRKAWIHINIQSCDAVSLFCCWDAVDCLTGK